MSKKQSILKILQHHQYCLNCIQILYSGRYELVLPVTICFVKISGVLSDILASQKCIKWGWHIIKGWMTVPMMSKHACRMALAINIPKYTFEMALGPCKQCFTMFSEGLKLSSRSDIQITWGMAQTGLSGSELGADLSAWLAKIMAQLNGSTAPSWAVCITTGKREVFWKVLWWWGWVQSQICGQQECFSNTDDTTGNKKFNATSVPISMETIAAQLKDLLFAPFLGTLLKISSLDWCSPLAVLWHPWLTS